MDFDWGRMAGGAGIGQLLLGPWGAVGGGLLGGITGSSNTSRPQLSPTQDTRTSEQKRVDEAYANLVTNTMANYNPTQPYNNLRVAGMSPYETQGMGYLQQYLNQPSLGSLGSAAGANLQGTLTGKFDPYTSPFYGALRDTAMYNRGQAVDLTNRDLAAQNRFFSTDRAGQIGDINAQTQNYLNQLLGGLAESERGRQMSAIPQALQLEEYTSKLPLQKTAAATTYGALPRQLEQSNLEAQYQDFLRKQNAQAALIPGGMSSSQMSYPAYDQSQLQKLMNLIGPLVQAGGSYFGGRSVM